jgi:putative peptidoglycan binding protein
MKRHWMAMAASICALAVAPSTALAGEVGRERGSAGQQVGQSKSGSNESSTEQSASSETSSTPTTVGASSAARRPGVHAKQPSDTGRRPEAHGRRRREAARAAGSAVEVLLAPGAGYQRARGSERVRALQRKLARLGFAPGPIDGRYGPVTTKAVERFQGSRGLRVDGIVGAQTLGTLRALAGPRTPVEGHPPPHPGSQLRSAPKAVRVLHERRRVPVLPLLPLLLGFAALGLATMSFGYVRTRARVARARAAARAAWAPTAPESPFLVRGVGAEPGRRER